MSVVVGEFYSKILEKNVTYCGFFPNDLTRDISLIYLLHGRGGNAKSFLQQTTLARKIQDTSMVAFSIDIGNSYYTNSEAFGEVFTFLITEFPKVIKEIHPFDILDEFVIGISMGGYGALKWLEKEPNRFKGVAILSPLLLMESLMLHIPTSKREIYSIFAEKNMPNLILNNLLPSDLSTKIFHFCGNHDFMFEDNKMFSNTVGCKLKRYNFQVWEGEHTWELWDRQLEIILKEFNQLIERR